MGVFDLEKEKEELASLEKQKSDVLEIKQIRARKAQVQKELADLNKQPSRFDRVKSDAKKVGGFAAKIGKGTLSWFQQNQRNIAERDRREAAARKAMGNKPAPQPKSLW